MGNRQAICDLIRGIIDENDPHEAYRQLLGIERSLSNAKKSVHLVVKNLDAERKEDMTRRMLAYYDALPEHKRTNPKTHRTRIQLTAEHFGVSVSTADNYLRPALHLRRHQEREDLQKLWKEEGE